MKLFKIIYHVIFSIFTILKNKNKIFKQQRVGDYSVYLTSHGRRIRYLNSTVFSLMSQTLLPKYIFITLTKNELENLSVRFSRFVEDNSAIRCVVAKEDYRSYKKFLAIDSEITIDTGEYSVIVDDDVIYPDYWMEKLIAGTEPGSICCGLAREIGDGQLYAQMKRLDAGSVSNNAIPIGVGGVAYPTSELFNINISYDDICDIAKYQDDIFLWAYFKAKGYKFKVAADLGRHPYIKPSMIFEKGLFEKNVDANNLALKKCMEFFDE